MKNRNAIAMGCVAVLGLSLLGSGTASAATLNEWLFDVAPTTLTSPSPGFTIYNEITSGLHLANPYMYTYTPVNGYANLQVAGGPFSNSVPYHSVGMMQIPATVNGVAYAGPIEGDIVAGLTNLTVEMWVNPLSQGTDMTVINFNGTQMQLTPVTGGYHLKAAEYTTVGYRLVGGTTLITPGSWWHLAMTYDGTTSTTYVNGVPDGTATAGSVAATADSGSGLLIGRDNLSGTFFYHGSLDEIRISDVALLPGAGTGLNELAFAATLVPEPTSAALLGLGGLLV